MMSTIGSQWNKEKVFSPVDLEQKHTTDKALEYDLLGTVLNEI